MRRAVSLVFAAAVLASGAIADRAQAAAPCWERVIADWSDNGRVDHTYPLACYRDAVNHMPEDLRAYSSAPDEIDRALAERRATRPPSMQTASAPLAATKAPGSDLATLVPPLAGVLAAIGVGWWLLRARRHPACEH